MRIVILTVLVACAMGMEFDLKNLQGMLGGLGGLGNIGGSIGGLMGQAKHMLAGLNIEDISSMIKDVDPDELKGIIERMPPQMLEMVEGMGITKEEISEAASHLPEHMDEIKGMMGSVNNGDLKKIMKSELQNMGMEVPEEEDMDSVMKTLSTQAKEKLTEFGLDIEDLKDIKGAMPKILDLLKEQLKAEGIEIDTENPDAIKAQLETLLRAQFELADDATPEEMRSQVMNKMRGYLEDLGIEVADEDMETPEKAMNALKKKFISTANGYGFEFKDESSFDEIKEAVMSKVKNSGIMENPMQYLPMLLNGLKGLGGMFNMGGEEQQQPMMEISPEQQMMMERQMMMQQRQMMMQRRPMPMNMNFEINIDGQNRPPTAFPAYLRGAEDALMHAYGDDTEVVRHVMTVQQGISQGAVSEEAVHELLTDLMHARLQARVLASRNAMLEQQLVHDQFEARIPVSRSPFLNHIRHKCKHGRTLA